MLAGLWINNYRATRGHVNQGALGMLAAHPEMRGLKSEGQERLGWTGWGGDGCPRRAGVPQRGLQLTTTYLTGQRPARPHRVAQGLQGGKKGCPGASSINDTTNQGSAPDPKGQAEVGGGEAGRAAGTSSTLSGRCPSDGHHVGPGARAAQLSNFS